ncbi:MAG TPA: gas vesicle protein [Terriglobales bacterium]
MTDPKYQALIEPFQSDQEEVSLLEVLDHVLHAGVVIQGSVVISIAGVDLIYLGLSAVLTSVETALKYIRADREQQKRGG